MYSLGVGPRAVPLKSVAELLAWRPPADDNRESDPLVSHVRLFRPGFDEERPMKVVVCHDMKGGYLNDAFVQGSEGTDDYIFRHFHLVDTFVYFSHYRVTIPPPGWIDACHRNGVRCLGTFITEWDDGYKDQIEMIANDRSVAAQLNTIASYYGFDGWLLNLEAPLPDAESAAAVVEIVRDLTTKMRSSHEFPQVLWYDSVTAEGKLDWQNELNRLNKPFFDACDGITTNYTWKENMPFTSAEMAGQKKDRVFMGIDVFGRNTFGGGQFDCYKAVEVAAKANVSIAIFAPGWTHENFGAAEFLAADDRLWKKGESALENRLQCRVYSGTGKHGFLTDFCGGNGQRFFSEGKLIRSQSWTHIGLTAPRPLLQTTPEGSVTSVYLEDDAFHGGSSVQLTINSSFEIAQCELFRFDPSLSDAKRLLIAVKRDKAAGSTVYAYLQAVGQRQVLLGPIGSAETVNRDVIEPECTWTLNGWTVYAFDLERLPDRHTDGVFSGAYLSAGIIGFGVNAAAGDSALTIGFFQLLHRTTPLNRKFEESRLRLPWDDPTVINGKVKVLQNVPGGLQLSLSFEVQPERREAVDRFYIYYASGNENGPPHLPINESDLQFVGIALSMVFEAAPVPCKRGDTLVIRGGLAGLWLEPMTSSAKIVIE